jgi:hypothetical protein
MNKLLKLYELTDETKYLEQLRVLMIEKDYISVEEADTDLFEVKSMAERTLKYRKFEGEGCDGLDSVRHNLRLLKKCNLPDTRLIICSMQGEEMFPDINYLLAESEFEDVIDRLIITAVPAYLAKFTSCNQVVSYQRRFMNAAKGHK